MASEATDVLAAPEAPAARDHPVDMICRRIPYLSTGHRARLRRIYLTESHAADGVVIDLLHGAGVHLPYGEPAAMRPWRLLTHSAALLAGTGTVGTQPHSRGKRLGAAFHAAGLSENRLLRLTAARGAGLDAQVVRTMRLVMQRGEVPVNLLTLFDLIGDDPDRAEAARIRIAQDYYAAEARSDEETSSDD